MTGITPFGEFHTAISLVAVGAGIVAFVRDKEIDPRNLVGKTYVAMTALTCLTGFGIFHHTGGFNKAHGLGIVTLVVLGIAGLAGRTHLFGRASRYVETISYSMTFFFHMIPTFTESFTRLPVSAPLAADDQSPLVQGAIGMSFVLFLIGTALQVWRLRSQAAKSNP